MLTLSMAAAYVPDDVVCENRNGRQLIVKTFSLLPGDDPETLREEPFEQEGFFYTFADMTKEEHPFETRKLQTQTITVNTGSKDLTVVLSALAADIPYDDGAYKGTLNLDHTTIQTVAAGYTTKSYTTTETKQIRGLDRNDPGYVPQTTVKNGQTLTLAGVEWSVEGTSPADGVLVPSSFMATATYTGKASSKVATGYVTTAQYTGEVVSGGIENVTYTVTYLGEAIPAPPIQWLPILLIAGGAALVSGIALLLFLLLRRNAKIYVVPVDGPEYILAGKQRVSRRKPVIDLRDVQPYPQREAMIAIRHRTARRLFGRLLTVRLPGFSRTHLIEQNEVGDYWFTVVTTQESEVAE